MRAGEHRERLDLSVEPLLENLGVVNLRGISWVIVGGESGPGVRELREEWVQSMMEQGCEAGVRFFFKHWGWRSKVKIRANVERTNL